MNIYHYFSSSVSRHPDKPSVVFDGRRTTYRQLDDSINRLAGAMAGLGVGRGSQVGLICRNSQAYIEIFFAAAKLGAVTEHFNWRSNTDTMLELVEASDVELLFISEDNRKFYDLLRGSLSRRIRYILVGRHGDGDYHALKQCAVPLRHTEECGSADPALMLYTSGTTGLGKGVLHSCGGFLIHTLLVLADLGWSEEVVLLNIQPLFHASSTGAYSTLLAGGTVVLSDKFDPHECLRLIQSEKVTLAGLVPHLIEWIFQAVEENSYDIASLDTIVYSGAPMPFETLDKAARVLGCRFLQLYGMTEFGPNIAALNQRDHIRLLAEGGRDRLPVGRPLPGTRVRIVDGAGRDCKPGSHGEIVAASDTLMLGYAGQPELTAASSKDGWFYTGDVGWLDEAGYLYLAGRKKHMIISGGENIYPVEVETSIRGMGQAVRDVAVFGIPSRRWGEVVKALVVAEPGSGLRETDVLEFCRQHLDPYKKPRVIQFVDTIPRNESGKLIREAISASYQNTDGYVDGRFVDDQSVRT